MLWARASYSITLELQIVFREGITDAMRLFDLSTLTAIADAAYPHVADTSVERVEALVSWACVASENKQDLRWLANLELAGLGMQRNLSLEQRRRAALQILDYPDDSDEFEHKASGQEAFLAYNMSETLWKLGTEEGIDCGPPRWADPRLQSN
jgi:hypothetical protein